jgi:hypothetical protein
MVYPLSVVADAAGNIFVADRELPGVWKVADGALSLHFQGEKKFGTPLNAVRCLALDHEGKLLARLGAEQALAIETTGNSIAILNE